MYIIYIHTFVHVKYYILFKFNLVKKTIPKLFFFYVQDKIFELILSEEKKNGI